MDPERSEVIHIHNYYSGNINDTIDHDNDDVDDPNAMMLMVVVRVVELRTKMIILDNIIIILTLLVKTILKICSNNDDNVCSYACNDTDNKNDGNVNYHNACFHS